MTERDVEVAADKITKLVSTGLNAYLGNLPATFSTLCSEVYLRCEDDRAQQHSNPMALPCTRLITYAIPPTETHEPSLTLPIWTLPGI